MSDRNSYYREYAKTHHEQVAGYQKKYTQSHPEITRYRQYRSHAKKFVTLATQKDLQELKQLIEKYVKKD